MKKNKVSWAIILLAICIISSLAIIRKKKDRNIMEKISELKRVTSPKFDSLNKIMSLENKFQYEIVELISRGENITANHLVDSAIKNNPEQAIFYTYKGMIYSSENSPYLAITQYSLSLKLAKTPFPLALANRAEAYMQIEQIKEAIADYRLAASINTDYFYQLAQAFERLPNRDSALKYYIMFHKNYPADKAVSSKINALSN